MREHSIQVSAVCEQINQLDTYPTLPYTTQQKAKKEKKTLSAKLTLREARLMHAT